jgi:Fe-S-cluster containining protein
MRTDKDNPGTWVKFKASMCQSCKATCCTMPIEVKAEDLVRLNLADTEEIESHPKKVAQRLIKDGVLSHYREKTGLFTLSSKSNGDCYFLDSNRLCTVYEIRPDVCRKFPKEIGRRLGHCPYIKKDRP